MSKKKAEAKKGLSQGTIPIKSLFGKANDDHAPLAKKGMGENLSDKTGVCSIIFFKSLLLMLNLITGLHEST
jgi:hypothetical protein